MKYQNKNSSTFSFIFQLHEESRIFDDFGKN